MLMITKGKGGNLSLKVLETMGKYRLTDDEVFKIMMNIYDVNVSTLNRCFCRT